MAPSTRSTNRAPSTDPTPSISLAPSTVSLHSTDLARSTKLALSKDPDLSTDRDSSTRPAHSSSSTTSSTDDHMPIDNAMAATGSNDRRNIFPFLKLPAELRNRVYDSALYHDRANGRLAAVALLRVCRQIHSEAKEIIYEESSYSIEVTTPKTI